MAVDASVEAVAALHHQAQRHPLRPRAGRRVRHADGLQVVRVGELVPVPGLGEHERDPVRERLREIGEPQPVDVVDDVLALGEPVPAVGREVVEGGLVGVRPRTTRQPHARLQVERARVGQARHVLVQQRAPLGERDGVQPPDRGRVTGADRRIEPARRLRLQLGGLRRHQVALRPVAVGGTAAAHDEHRELLARVQLLARDDGGRRDGLPPEIRPRQRHRHPGGPRQRDRPRPGAEEGRAPRDHVGDQLRADADGTSRGLERLGRGGDRRRGRRAGRGRRDRRQQRPRGRVDDGVAGPQQPTQPARVPGGALLDGRSGGHPPGEPLEVQPLVLPPQQPQVVVEARAVEHARRGQRRRVARQVDGEHAEAVGRPVAQPRERSGLDAADDVGALQGRVGRRGHHPLGGLAGAGLGNPLDREPGARSGEAPPVPAADRLVQVELAVTPVEPRRLQEADVGGVGEDGLAAGGRRHVDAPLVQAVPRARRVVPHLDAEPADDVVQPQRPGRVGGQRLRLCDPRADLGQPVPPGQREARGAHGRGGRGGLIAVELARVLPRQVAQELVELEPRRVRVGVEHHPVRLAERQRTVDPRVGGLRLEDGPVHPHRRPPRGQHLEVGIAGAHRHRHRGGPRQRRPRLRGRHAVDDHVDDQAQPPQQRGHGAERGDPRVEVGLRGLGPGRRRPVAPLLVVAAHGMGVDEQAQLGLAAEVPPDEPVELRGDPPVGVQVVEDAVERRSRLGRALLLPRLVVSAPVQDRPVQRPERGHRVPQPPADQQLAIVAAALPAEQLGDGALRVQRGDGVQDRLRHRVADDAGARARGGADHGQVQVDGVLAHPARRVGADGRRGQAGGGGERNHPERAGHQRPPRRRVGPRDRAQRQGPGERASADDRGHGDGQAEAAAAEHVDPALGGGVSGHRRARADQLVGEEDAQLEGGVVGERVRQGRRLERGGHGSSYEPSGANALQ